MKNVFEIDYANHPSYRHIKLNFFELFLFRFLFFKALILSFLTYVTRRKYCLLESTHHKKVGASSELIEFSQRGILQLKDDKLIDFLSLKLKNYIADVQKKIDGISPNIRDFGDCIIGYHRKKNIDLFNELEEKLFLNQSIAEILDQSFSNGKLKLVYFQIHINQEDDKAVFKHDDLDVFDEEMNFFHVDTNLNTLKAMIYLSDVVDENNGAFEFVPGTHKLFNAKDFIKRKITRNTGAYRRDLAAKKKLLAIPESFRFKNEFSDFPKDSDLGKLIQTNKVTCTGESKIILFNPLGIHRGGRVKKGKRIAAQLVFCPDNSWQTG